ncbi:SUKH-3 domain-containing protein [Streptomyces sp. NPDC055632]
MDSGHAQPGHARTGHARPGHVQPVHAAAWARLRERYRSRSVDGRRGAPALGRLIEAARRDAVLGAMYPWVSMDQLGVSAGESWEEWGHSPLPALFARPGGYEVVARTRPGEVVRLSTADPVEAVAFAARSVRGRGGSPAEEPYAWPPEVEAVLRDAGWYPGRSVDTAGWKERLERDGFRVHAAAEDFLREFGGLEAGHLGSGVTRAREPFDLDPLLGLGEDDRFGEWSEEIGHSLFPVGGLGHGHAFLGLDESGELYVVEGWLARFGRMPEAMENLVLGVMPVHMPGSG